MRTIELKDLTIEQATAWNDHAARINENTQRTDAVTPAIVTGIGGYSATVICDAEVVAEMNLF